MAVNKGKKVFDLELRLIDFSVSIVFFTDGLSNTRSSTHLGEQLLRSGTSPSLNYGEAKAAESKKDFIHKMKVCFKELRESYNCSRILHKAKSYKNEEQIVSMITERNELIAIFIASINTASK